MWNILHGIGQIQLFLIWSFQNMIPSCVNSLTYESSPPCKFPSIYKRKLLYECIYYDEKSPEKGYWWCPTEDNYDYFPIFWRSCPNTTQTYGGNDPGNECHFPFLDQNGQLQTTCVSSTSPAMSGRWWCSTTADFRKDGKWTHCKPTASDILPCSFLYSDNPSGSAEFQDSTLSQIIPRHHPTKDRSSSTPGDSIYSSCVSFQQRHICVTVNHQLRECPETSRTYGGNDPGRQCHFPFLLPDGNVIRDSCVKNQPHEDFSWCSTTYNFPQDKKWTLCKPPRDPPLVSVLTSQWRLTVSSVAFGMLITMISIVGVIFGRVCWRTCCAEKSQSYQTDLSLSIAVPLAPSAPSEVLYANATTAMEEVPLRMSEQSSIKSKETLFHRHPPPYEERSICSNCKSNYLSLPV